MIRTLPFIFIISFFCGCSALREDENIIFAGDRVPHFEVIDELRPESPPFNSAYIGAPTLIYFFWSECGECREQTPYIVDICNKYVGELNVICIARGGDSNSSYDMAMNYWQEVYSNMRPYLMPSMGYDYSRRIYSKFAYSGVPRIYLVDRYGIVDSTYEGFQHDNYKLEYRIGRLLNIE